MSDQLIRRWGGAAALSLGLGLGAGCAAAPRVPVAEAPSTVPAQRLPALSRDDFNRLAVTLDLPLYWIGDERDPGQLGPAELAVVGVGVDRARYVREDRFTPAFEQARASLVEARRQEAVARELAQAKPTLILTDLSGADAAERALVSHLAAAAGVIEELFALQKGSLELEPCLTPADPPSRALFRRNQGPWCVAPDTQADPFCNACPRFPPQVSGLYPPELAADPRLCELLANHPDAERLLDHFTVVRRGEGGLRAIPYHEIYADRVARVARELRAAAASLPDPQERAFRTYLEAAARAFETDGWAEADEAWAAMNGRNSRYYLRVGPDETYFEPCQVKAGFHLSFARIDTDLLDWQDKLTALRDEMEQQAAALIGPAYPPRAVSFRMPDFIEIILNAGQSRMPLGVTAGQNLPNWGPVAREGRGRAMVGSNLYQDPDSLAVNRLKAASLLDAASLGSFCEGKRLCFLDILLHEANHNFGPYTDFRLEGRRAVEIFGGPAATILEELKAEVGAFVSIGFLRRKGLLNADETRQVYNRGLLWSFGQIALGLTDGAGKPMPYGQVAVLLLAHLGSEGAVVWEEGAVAANGQDRGRFVIRHDRIGPAVERLYQRVGRIKATGDVAGARALLDPAAIQAAASAVHAAEIAERIWRFPKASFVYAVLLQ